MIFEQKNYYTFRFFALILLALTLLCHGLSLQAEFMIDDYAYLDPQHSEFFYTNFFDFFIRFYGHHYNPLDTLLNFSLFKVFSYSLYFYAFNLFLFYGNSILLFINIKNWTQNKIIAATSAILFTTHPINAENLSHITFNTVFLCSIFLQLSMIGFWHYISCRKQRKVLFYLSLLCFLVGLLFLETALLFPIFICFLCLLKPVQERLRILYLSLPYWALSFSYFILWFFMTRHGIYLGEKIHHLKVSLISYLATCGLLLNWYLGNLFFPNDSVFIKSIAPLTEHLLPWLGNLTVFLVIVFSLIYVWRKTLKSFALLWFLTGFIFMIPASLTHAYQMGMVIEPNWFFFSSMGFFMFFALILHDLKQHIRPLLSHTLLAAIIIFWSITSYRHHVIAKTEVSYLTYWLSISPGNFIPSLRLAHLYVIANSPNIPSELIQDMNKQATLFIKTRKYIEAANLIDKLILSEPESSHRKILEFTRIALAARIEKTFAERKAVLKPFESDKRPPNEYLLMASELDQVELRMEAIEVLNHGLKLYPNNENLIYIKAVILANQNNFNEAKTILISNPQNIRFANLLNEIIDLEKK